MVMNFRLKNVVTSLQELAKCAIIQIICPGTKQKISLLENRQTS